MNSNAISQERISWIDTAKGFGIIAIILGHLGTGSLGEWFYTFHVPLFFFLSGYTFSTKYDWKTFLRKKIRGILVPYLALGIPMLVFDTILTEKSFASLCTGFLLQQRQWTIWFLTVLFLLNVTFYGCIKIFPKLLIVGVVSILASVCGFLYCKMGGGMYWNIDICAMAMPFFFCGYMYKQQGHVFDDCFMRHLRITALTFLILNVSFAYLVGGGIDMFGGSYGLFPLTYITALCGIFFSVQLSKIVSFPFIRYIGKNSIIYFAWHQTIVYPIVWKMLSIMNFPFTNSAPILIVLEKCLELILILSITTTINEVIIRSRFKFIIGK